MKSRLQRGERHARSWFWAWTSTYSALIVGQSIVLPLTDEARLHRTFSINAASSALGLIFTATAPPRLMGMQSKLRRHQERNGDGNCPTLAFLEKQLARASKRERFGKSWILHGGNVLFNAGVGLVLGLAWGYWRYAFLTRMAGVFVGELVIWTRPTDATRILSDYKSGLWGVRSPTIAPQFSVQPWTVPQGGGLTLQLSL